MEEKLNFTQLLQKPIAMMTGEELCFLITKSVESTEAATPQVASKGNYDFSSYLCDSLVYDTAFLNAVCRGYTASEHTGDSFYAIVVAFGCSVPTANRNKKSGIIDKAITQIGRKIVVDADLALSLAKEAGGIHIKE